MNITKNKIYLKWPQQAFILTTRSLCFPEDDRQKRQWDTAAFSQDHVSLFRDPQQALCSISSPITISKPAELSNLHLSVFTLGNT